MYDTEKRVELVKKRVLEKYRWKKRRGIYRLSALCIALFAFLVGTVDRKSTRLNSSHASKSRMPSSA